MVNLPLLGTQNSVQREQAEAQQKALEVQKRGTIVAEDTHTTVAEAAAEMVELVAAVGQAVEESSLVPADFPGSSILAD